MTRFLTYTRLRLKTVFRLFPVMLILLLLLGLALGAMLRLRASAGSRDETAGDESARLDIGLVGIDAGARGEQQCGEGRGAEKIFRGHQNFRLRLI